MTARVNATIIGITWGLLLTLYALHKRFLRNVISPAFPLIAIDSEPCSSSSPGSILSRIGVLIVFGANIITFFLVFAGSLSETVGKHAMRFQIDLPRRTNVIGSVLFVLNSVWGLLVLVFNPNYTPLYEEPSGQILLATQGPYRLIRHPRYASEGVLNIVLFLFTDIWVSLVGIIAWPALYLQARAEEAYLMQVAEEAYGDYSRKTGMFFPRLRTRDVRG